MDPVTWIITPIVESLLVPIKRHLGFLVSSSNYVSDMHAKVTSMDGTTHDMHIKQASNKANSLLVPHHVPVWLAEVDTIKAKAEKIPIGRVGCFSIKMRYKAGKQSYDIAKVIDRLMKEKSDIVWTDEIIPLARVSPPRPSTSVTVQVDDQNKYRIKSRDLIFNVALKFLDPNNNKSQKMALCGMAGVGKTTMMEQLKKAAKDKKMFDLIVKVEVGQNLNPIDVQQSVAEYTGRALTETTKDIRAERLQKRFKEMSEEGKKRVLVILDDVWEKFNLKDIGLMSPLPNGFKLLLTSRDENVCTQMGVENHLIFKIVVLKDPEAKLLFWETAGLVPEHDLQQIGEDIIKRCGGLPIAIKTISSVLRDNKEKYAWEDALFRLQNKEFRVLHNIFEISYNNLKEDDKAIFLLSGLFLKDIDIGIEDLVRYGWGLKVFKNLHTLAQARSRVNTCVYNLLRSNLLIKSDCEGCVKMHDLVHDFILSNFSKVKQASIVNHDNNVSEQLKEDISYERILLKCGGMFEFPVDFNYPNLALLNLMDGDKLLKFPDDFYTRMEKLMVVTYENMYRPLLPRNLINLRALSLRSCSLISDDISFLGDLINLEVLSLVNCGIHKVPSEIGKLEKLKLLDLTGCVDLCISYGVFGNLRKLEELYMRVSKGRVIRLTDANCDELKMLSGKLSALEVEFVDNNTQPKYMSFEKLERFRISMGCLLEKNKFGWGYNDEYSFKNTLKLVTSSMELLECKINELFTKTEILHLEVNDMSYVEDILMHPPKTSFCNLKSLHVSHCASLTFLFTIPMIEGLSNLETLKIRSCPFLKSVVHGAYIGARVIKFDKLKLLSLKDLPELISLCEPINVMELPQLFELRLDLLQAFSSIFPDNNISTSANQPFLNKEVMIPTLEKLKISNMKNLKSIWPREITSSEEEGNNISMLREIEVYDCHTLVNLFPCNPMRLLSHLEELTLERCGSIEVLFNINLGCGGKMVTGEKDNVFMLRKIVVYDCNSLVDLFPTSPVRLLSHLEELKVAECGSIEALFNIDLGKTDQLSSSNLRSIKLESLKKLREVWRIKDDGKNHHISCFQAVESIYIEKCEGFTNIVTPTTTNFDMRSLKVIRILNRKEQKKIRVSKEDVSKVGALMSIVALPSYQIKLNFYHLSKIEFCRLQRVEVVFQIEIPGIIDDLVTTQQQPSQPLLLLPYLEDLHLEHMNTMSHVWKCSNWNEFFILQKNQPQSSFQNLTTINLYDCNSIKYLFSPLMVKLLSNLKKININWCNGMEEVVSSRDDEEGETMTSTSAHTTVAFFPHLHVIVLSYLDNLKHIGGGFANGITNVINGHSKFSQVDVVPWSLCQYSREIHISYCHALSSVIPSYAAGQMQNLQLLSVERCKSLKEVFETEEINNSNTSGCSSSNVDPRCVDATITIPSPRSITMHKLRNLKILKIVKCDCLGSIFTFSTLESLKKLEKLSIRDCKEVRVIVREEYRDQTKVSSNNMVFSNLKSIELYHLPKLAGFFLGANIDFDWPLLDDLMINDCPQMMALTFGRSTTPRLKHLCTELGKHNPELGLNSHATSPSSLDVIRSHPTISEGIQWSFRSLVECNLQNSNRQKIFPSNKLQLLQKLETIHAYLCSYVEEVFEVTNNESQTVVNFPNLREVNLKLLDSLKYIWKSNECRKLEFPNLTRVSIDLCNSLEYVFTCSMVGCVKQLQELHITQCRNMKTIVKEEEEYDAKVGEIIEFPFLKSLRLEDLSSVKGFCLEKKDFTIPSLDTLVIKNCPKIMVFTEGSVFTPNLTLVETSFGTLNVGEDINSFIVTTKQEGYKFGEIGSSSMKDDE